MQEVSGSIPLFSTKNQPVAIITGWFSIYAPLCMNYTRGIFICNFSEERQDEDTGDIFHFYKDERDKREALTEENAALKKKIDMLLAERSDRREDASGYIFKRYEEYRDKCDALSRELEALKSE